ncbi:hypothetical protein [Calothrix sp. CCY 0018]|uniref:hypothetical protein n=1 Tax=Calothrix sp. CCY 0018 TaxID=3103864 RepID=UPI0039C5A9F0
MGVKRQVFGSLAERNFDYQLSKQWSKNNHIYHNLPFLNIFYIDDQLIKKIEITDNQIDYLKKTSIDFTLCNNQDEPLICIEFDGMQQGFNVGNKYYCNNNINNLRKKSFELKLKIAHSLSFPFVVVSSNEFQYLSNDIKLCIVDGIIVQAISYQVFESEMKQVFNPHKYGMTEEEFLELPLKEQYYFVKKDCLHIEVDTYFNNNPVFQKASKLHESLGDPSYSLKPVKGINFHIYHGRQSTINLKEYGIVEAEIILPKFDVPKLYMGSLVDEISRLLACNKAIKFMQNF